MAKRRKSLAARVDVVAELESAPVVETEIDEDDPPVPLRKSKRVSVPKRTEAQTAELGPKLTAVKTSQRQAVGRRAQWQAHALQVAAHERFGGPEPAFGAIHTPIGAVRIV